uniref:Sushi domain-containing protein n=1 Tax=Monodelphis domestica TaxID=13616 RepID=A0A5F8HIR6_MONDO
MLFRSSGQCYSPPKLNTAILKNSSKSVFDIGDTLIYECLPGYMKKKIIAICLESSSWSSVNDDMCKRKTCPTPADLLNGRVQTTGSSQFGSTITYSCNEGYVFILFSILSAAIRCDLPPTIPNGRYRKTQEYFYYGMVVSYECNTGPRGEKLYDLVGQKTLYCTSEDNKVGIWNSPPPQCITLAKCQTPVIAHGRIVSFTRPPYLLNDAVELECDPGFTMKGSKIVRCQINSQWEPALPMCFREVNCSLPEFMIGAQNVSTKKTYNFGAIFTLKCDEGYMLEGSPQSQCQEDQRWDPPLAACKSGKYSMSILLGSILLIIFVGVTLAIISKHREG